MHLKNFDFKGPQLLKVVFLAFVGIIIIGFALSLILSSLGSARDIGGIDGISLGGVPSFNSAPGGYRETDASYGYGGSPMMPELSIRNIYPPLGGTTGETAEEFEVTDYSATIETRDLEGTCGVFTDLKGREYVIFESSTDHDTGCNFTFKVPHTRVAEILSVIEGLNPKELSENTYTIKRQIDDFTSETEILEKKQASIDETLQSALRAYDEITDLATRTQNADALAKIIDSKIQIIERLTQASIAISEQLDRLERAKAEQLDRLEYTYFHVAVYENKFVDGEAIGDSWKEAVKDFVRNVNEALQNVTINLATFLLFILQYILYAFIILIVAKYGWQVVKMIWKK